MKRKRSNYKIKVFCSVCGKEKEINPCRVRGYKNFFCGPEHRGEFQKNKVLSEETKRKISQTKGGIKKEKRICVRPGCGIEFEVRCGSKKQYHSRECSCKTIGERSHNNIWNKGLSVSTDQRVAENIKKSSITKLKRYRSGEIVAWNKGLTAENDPRMAKLNEHLTKMRNTEGEWKEKWRESMRKGQVKAWSEGKYNRPITSPEQLTWNYLETIGFCVKWFKDSSKEDPKNTWYFQYPFEDAFVPDFACPDLKAVIEVHGCAIHAHDLEKCKMRTSKVAWNDFAQNNRKRDRKKYYLYHKHEWKWAIVWQCEANNGDFHRINKYLLNNKESKNGT